MCMVITRESKNRSGLDAGNERIVGLADAVVKVNSVSSMTKDKAV